MFESIKIVVGTIKTLKHFSSLKKCNILVLLIQEVIKEKMATQKMRIKLRAYEHSLIDEACKRIVETAGKNGAKVSGPIPLPTDREVVTVIRSPHKDKDSREQFESKTHKRLIDIYNPTNKAIDALMKLELPAGVEINIKL